MQVYLKSIVHLHVCVNVIHPLACPHFYISSYRQEAFMEQYFVSQRDSIFKHVEVWAVDCKEYKHNALYCLIMLVLYIT